MTKTKKKDIPSFDVDCSNHHRCIDCIDVAIKNYGISATLKMVKDLSFRIDDRRVAIIDSAIYCAFDFSKDTESLIPPPPDYFALFKSITACGCMASCGKRGSIRKNGTFCIGRNQSHHAACVFDDGPLIRTWSYLPSLRYFLDEKTTHDLGCLLLGQIAPTIRDKASNELCDYNFRHPGDYRHVGEWSGDPSVIFQCLASTDNNCAVRACDRFGSWLMTIPWDDQSGKFGKRFVNGCVKMAGFLAEKSGNPEIKKSFLPVAIAWVSQNIHKDLTVAGEKILSS